MTPTAMLLALTIVMIPPDPPIGPDAPVRGSQATIGGQDGGSAEGATGRVVVAVVGELLPGRDSARGDGSAGDDGANWEHSAAASGANLSVPLYIHALDRPAVNVDGLDPQFLAESVAVAKCESTHREAAVNPSGATGLLQVMLPLHLPKAQALGYTASDLLRAEPNLRVAHVIWARQGWRPWSCRHTPVPVVGSDWP